MEDRVADLRARWTPEATAAAVAFLESRPTGYELPTMEQIDKALLRNVNLRWAVFHDVGFKNARFVKCNLSQATFSECYLRRAQFEKCDIVNSRFESCDFSQAAITDSRVDFASFKHCEISLDTIHFPAVLEHAKLGGRDAAAQDALGRNLAAGQIKALQCGAQILQR